MPLSVIIPTYRPKDYIWECLGAIVRQTLVPKKFKVFIVLNGCNEPYRTQIRSHIVENMPHLSWHFW